MKEKSIFDQKIDYKLELKSLLSPHHGRKEEGGLRINGYFKKAYENRPLISIVTVVFNGEKHLEQTIKSVLEQTYDNVEYIVIDGGSTDLTLEIIKKYEDKIDYWVSEPDDGIFFAMNQGLVLATGDYIGFINADDHYHNNQVFSKLVLEINSNATVDFFYSDEHIISESQELLSIRKARRPGEVSDDLGIYIPHQSSFVKLDVHRKYIFDTSLRISSDRILFAELFKNGHSNLYLPFIIANYMEGGRSYNEDMARREFYYYDFRYYGVWGVIKRYQKEIRSKIRIRSRFKKLLGIFK